MNLSRNFKMEGLIWRTEPLGNHYRPESEQKQPLESGNEETISVHHSEVLMSSLIGVESYSVLIWGLTQTENQRSEVEMVQRKTVDILDILNMEVPGRSRRWRQQRRFMDVGKEEVH